MSTSEHDEQSFGDASGRELQRHLTNRHIQLMAIGGAIGIGWSLDPSGLSDHWRRALSVHACDG